MARSVVGSLPLFSRPYNNNVLFTPLHLSFSARHVTSSAVTMPSFEVLGGARDRFLPVLPHLSRPYHAFPLLAANRHIETIFASFFRSLFFIEYPLHVTTFLTIYSNRFIPSVVLHRNFLLCLGAMSFANHLSIFLFLFSNQDPPRSVIH